MYIPPKADYSSTQYSKATPDKSLFTFKGLSLLPVAGDGEFTDMLGLSARKYPCLAPRAVRAKSIRATPSHQEITGYESGVPVSVVSGAGTYSFYVDELTRENLDYMGLTNLPAGTYCILEFRSTDDKLLYKLTENTVTLTGCSDPNYNFTATALYSVSYADSSTISGVTYNMAAMLFPNGTFPTQTASITDIITMSFTGGKPIYGAVFDAMSCFTRLSSNGKIACFDTENNFYYDGALVVTIGGSAPSHREFYEFQKKLLIWPDKTAYDIESGSYDSLGGSVAGVRCMFSASVQDSVLADAVNYSLLTIPPSTGRVMPFEAGDTITVSRCTNTDNNRSATIDHIRAYNTTGAYVYFAENTFVDATENGTISIKMDIPDMDYLCVQNNRVWGCKDSTIYASKLGSADNWFSFSGIASDSYTLDVASGGSFTGCAPLGANVAFFKENVIHKIVGTKPANFQLSTVLCPSMGLEEGAERSIVNVGGVLYYKSRLGVMAFVGGTPELVSEGLYEAYDDGISSGDGRRYYICSTRRTDSLKTLLVYDTFYGTWHIDSTLNIVDMKEYNGSVDYLVSGGREIVEIGRDYDGTADDTFNWYGIMKLSEYTTDKKYLNKLRIRADVPAGAQVMIDVSADGDNYINVLTLAGAFSGSIASDTIPMRCDNYAIKIHGRGDVTIYQLDRVYNAGSDIN